MQKDLGRRRRQRFPLHLDFRWQRPATREEGQGQLINISSTGVLFTSTNEFDLGERVELLIRWPKKLDRKHPLKLAVSGRVVRSESSQIAVEIDRYEFRVTGAQENTLRKGPTSTIVQAWREHFRKTGGRS